MTVKDVEANLETAVQENDHFLFYITNLSFRKGKAILQSINIWSEVFFLTFPES